ncbi:hypothetical protein K458DRAFT_183919 [Lentithecium fluviatile CBS 122367]|uniref:Uncharacterized protein n=1 Tax=Lentithecium fluviatile CBS 122367 TaxID=1168545 RepID=A0A6G1IDB7_9PLEO|nr:hypothetical protein K458DRAFT_183919 [Lentithecium fluviatile CBS 122367]
MGGDERGGVREGAEIRRREVRSCNGECECRSVLDGVAVCFGWVCGTIWAILSEGETTKRNATRRGDGEKLEMRSY